MDHVVEKTLRSPINHLLLLLHSSHNQTFSLFSFTFLLLLCLSHYMSLCVSRASIVQKRVIYFQDEGSLTVQLCEKGNNSCPSSLSFHSWLCIMLLVSCALRVVYPPSVFGAHYLPLFHTIFKKNLKPTKPAGENCEDNKSWMSWEFKYCFLFRCRAQPLLSCYLWFHCREKWHSSFLKLTASLINTALLRDNKASGLSQLWCTHLLYNKKREPGRVVSQT